MNTTFVTTFGREVFNYCEIQPENTDIMNKNFEYSFMFLTIPWCMMTIFLNACVLIILLKKEKTSVNKLIKLDCFINIMYTSLAMFHQSPYYSRFCLGLYCYSHLMVSYTSVVSNQMLHVAIVSFWYLNLFNINFVSIWVGTQYRISQIVSGA